MLFFLSLLKFSFFHFAENISVRIKKAIFFLITIISLSIRTHFYVFSILNSKSKNLEVNEVNSTQAVVEVISTPEVPDTVVVASSNYDHFFWPVIITIGLGVGVGLFWYFGFSSSGSGGATSSSDFPVEGVESSNNLFNLFSVLPNFSLFSDGSADTQELTRAIVSSCLEDIINEAISNYLESEAYWVKIFVPQSPPELIDRIRIIQESFVEGDKVWKLSGVIFNEKSDFFRLTEISIGKPNK